jgi:DNA-binding PadR family transcriptional regulator
MPGRALSTLAVLVLSSLSEASRHGYALRKDVTRRSGGDVAPGATSLYRTVWQLLDEGLVAENDARPAADLDDERRRYFKITPAGRRTLSAELARLQRLLAAARPRQATPKPRP